MAEPATSTPDQGNCATNHMTFDPNDFSNTTQPRRTCIANANGVTYPEGLYYLDDFNLCKANHTHH
ncbi:hypothetical protein AAG906_012104 [Vitis piasezkii]